MKLLSFVLFTTMLMGGCQNFSSKKNGLPVGIDPTSQPADSPSIDIMSSYLGDNVIPEEFKAIYHNPGRISDTSDIAMSIPDSLFSRDKKRHRFYFLLTNRVMDVSDGAYSEPLYLKINKYAKAHPKEMLHYLNGDSLLPANSYTKWASAVMAEIGIECERHEYICIQETQKDMWNNCTACDNNDSIEISRFIDEMHLQLSKWRMFNSNKER